MASQRDYSYDILKGIGIILVLAGHTMIPQGLHNLIYAFHMPLFFFVSGCLYKHDNLIQIIRHKATKLLMPWIIFCVILSFVLGVLEYHQCRTIAGVIYFYESDFLKGISGNRDSLCMYGTIWFLICLFEVTVLYSIILSHIRHRWVITIICLCLYICGYSLCQYKIVLPFFLDTTLSVIIYFHIGYIFRKDGLDKKTIPLNFAAIGLVLFLTLCVFLNPYTDFKENHFEWYILPLSLLAITSLLYVIRPMTNIYTAQLVTDAWGG